MPITRRGGVAINYRKPIAATSYAVKPAADSDVTTAPTQTAGTGVPAAAEPNGSTWQRIDAPDADNAFYMRIGGAWVALRGATP